MMIQFPAPAGPQTAPEPAADVDELTLAERVDAQIQALLARPEQRTQLPWTQQNLLNQNLSRRVLWGLLDQIKDEMGPGASTMTREKLVEIVETLIQRALADDAEVTECLTGTVTTRSADLNGEVAGDA